MDQIQHHNQSLTHLIITSQVLKRATQLLLSLYMFSFFFNSLKFHFSTLSIQFLSQSLNKNFIFLICNGLLMFIAKTSGFISLSPASDHNPAQLLKKTEDIGNALMEKEVSLENTGHLVDYPMEGECEDSNLVLEDKEEEAPNGLLNNSALGGIPVAEDEESDKELDSIVFVISEEEKEEDEDEEWGGGEEDGLLSTDELNKKFDEFIRRMKEEIRIEAQQQLVMAY